MCLAVQWKENKKQLKTPLLHVLFSEATFFLLIWGIKMEESAIKEVISNMKKYVILLLNYKNSVLPQSVCKFCDSGIAFAFFCEIVLLLTLPAFSI